MTCQIGAAPRVRYGDTQDINQPSEPYCFAHQAYVADGVCDKARIAELEAALRDCIPFVAVHVDKYRREFGLAELHPTHAAILDRASMLTGGDVLSAKLKGAGDVVP